MAATAAAPPFYLVKVNDLPHHLPFDFRTDIIDRAREFYSSFLGDRSYFAPRHDAESSVERAWAALSFTAQDDAIKCAQWLLEEPRLTALGPPAVTVLRRLQSPADELAQAAAEQAQRESDLATWQDKTARLTAAQEKLAFGGAAAAPSGPENGREVRVQVRKKQQIVDLDDSRSYMSLDSAEAPPKAPERTGSGAMDVIASSKQQPQRVVLQTTGATGGAPLAKKKAAKKAPAPPPSKPAAPAPKHAAPPVKRAPAPPPAPPPVIEENKKKVARNMLREALGAEMSTEEVKRSQIMREELAGAIVAALLDLNLISKAFVEKVRQMNLNLRQNAALRASVLEGSTAPAALVAMNAQELATREIAEELKQIEEKSLKAATTGDGLAADTWHSTEAALAALRRMAGGSGGRPGPISPEPVPTVRPSGAGKAPKKSAGALREAGWYEKLAAPEVAAPEMVEAVEGIGAKRGAAEGGEERPAKAVRFRSEPQASPAALKRPGGPGNAPAKSALHAPPPPSPSCVPPAWGLPVEHPTGAWQPSEELTAGATILSGGTLSWDGLSSGTASSATAGGVVHSVHAVGLRPPIDAPGVVLTLPRELHVSEGLTVAGMEAELSAAGVQAWQCHRFWLTGASMPGSSHAEDAPPKAHIVGRLILSSRGHIMKSLDEAWAGEAGTRRGWVLFLALPTPAVATAAGIPLTEIDAARRARALLGLALPLYFGMLWPKGRHDPTSMAVWTAGPAALYLEPSALNCVWNTRRSRIPNLATDWRKCFGEGGNEVRLRPRPPPPGSSSRSSDEVAIASLEMELRGEERVLIAQEGIVPHADLAVAAPHAGAGGAPRGYLLLGAWSRQNGPKGEKTIHDLRKYGWPVMR